MEKSYIFSEFELYVKKNEYEKIVNLGIHPAVYSDCHNSSYERFLRPYVTNHRIYQ